MMFTRRNYSSTFYYRGLGITAMFLFLFYLKSSVAGSRNFKLHIDDRTLDHIQEKAMLRRGKIEGNAAEFYNILADEAICPNLFRVGRVGDGGKWMCGPQFIADWDKKCIIYSFGIQGDSSFETEIHAITKGKCDLVAVDMIQFEVPTKELKEIGAEYVLTKIDNVTTYDSTTVTDLMKRFDHSYIDVLKMDIEGSEYYIADELFKLGICQMMVELHTEGTKYDKFIGWLKKASAAGYYLIHHEINVKYMHCVEVTLLHEKCFDRFGDVLPLTKFLSTE